MVNEFEIGAVYTTYTYACMRTRWLKSKLGGFKYLIASKIHLIDTDSVQILH